MLLKEVEFTEGRSTGIPKILGAMKENGSPPAEFEFDEDHSYVIVRLPVQSDAPQIALPVDMARPESRPESDDEWRSHTAWKPEWDSKSIQYRIMVAISRKPLGRTEISESLGHKAISGAAKQALADLLAIGLIEPTIPEKPNSRLQKYRLVDRRRTK